MTAQGPNALQHLPALLLVHQRHKAVSDFEAQLIELDERFERLLRRRFLICFLFWNYNARNLRFFVAAPASEHKHSNGEQQEGNLWQSGNQGQSREHSGSDEERLLSGKELLVEIRSETGVRGGSRDNQTASN